MKVFKNNSCASEIPVSKFKHTLACLAKACWNKCRTSAGTYEYYGYSANNMLRAFKAKYFPSTYSHYHISFNEDGHAFIQNNSSVFWVLKFDSKQERRDFVHNVIMPHIFSFKYGPIA